MRRNVIRQSIKTRTEVPRLGLGRDLRRKTTLYHIIDIILEFGRRNEDVDCNKE